jgi:hypothetical protein
MNDFTKDELENLYLGLGWVGESTGYGEHFIKLRNKIQSMIDSNCEHADKYIDYDYQLTRCKKCLEIVE